MGLSWQMALGVVSLIYFYSHYFFASSAAHIGAMYSAFLTVATACGAPGTLSALLLGFLSSLMGCTTTYGIGSAPPYFGGGYVPQSKWYSLGFIISIFHMAVWLGIGIPVSGLKARSLPAGMILDDPHPPPTPCSG